jgi:hypothetical protein
MTDFVARDTFGTDAKRQLSNDPWQHARERRPVTVRLLPGLSPRSDYERR